MFRAIKTLSSVFTQKYINIKTSRVYIKLDIVEMRVLEENTAD
jgi:hypothetical protein